MTKEPKAIEFKAGSLTVLTAIVRDLDKQRIEKAMHALLGGSGEGFDGEATIIDLGQLTQIPDQVDWADVSNLLRRYGLQPVALKNAPEALQHSARAAGLAVLAKPVARVVTEPTARMETEAPEPVVPEPTRQPQEPVAPEIQPAPHQTTLFPPPITSATTKVIDRLVRSGQQIYARGGDLILLNGVSPGAEVIADGSIHCYGPLRGRALAGAQGNTAARIFCSNFGPELISIAGVYRNFEGGIPENVAARPAQALLRTTTSGGVEKHTLHIEPLQLD